MFGSLKKMFGGSGESVKKEILAPVEGEVVPMNQVNDPMFSQEILGKGVAIIPAVGRAVAPADGEVIVVFDTKHAVSMKTTFGAEIIIHIGLDTVNLNGEHYTTHVKVGDKVKAGDLLVEFDIPKIVEAGYEVITPVLICNTPDFPDMVCHTGMTVKELDPIIEL